jgi:maltose O-acetyltransferase
MSLKTNRQKMLAGETYNFNDPDLEAQRQQVKTLLRTFNGATDAGERREVLERLLGRIGSTSSIEPPFHCTYGQHTTIGDHSYLNFSCVVLDNNRVQIGHHVMIGPAVQIYTAAHPVEASIRNEGWEVAKPIIVEDNVWIGGGAVLLPGVRVGQNAVVGAGAVVSHDVPPGTVVAGNPARVIREI